MSSVEIQNELEKVNNVADVVEFSANTLLGGKFKQTQRDEFWDGKGNEYHILEDGQIVCRIIEIPEDGPTFRDVKSKLKRQGKKAGELFSVVVTTESGEGNLLEKQIKGSIKFVRVESRISSETVDVKHDLRYFEVDPDHIEPLYIDYLNNLQIGKRSLSDMEDAVTDVFSIKRITKRFYKDFSDIFHDKLKPAVNGLENEDENLNSYTQLVVNRILFLMFIQEKGWLNRNKRYIQDNYAEVREDSDKDPYEDFFKPLFFEALNDTEDSPDDLGDIPYLNGGLFEKREEEEDVEIDEEFFEALLSPEEDEYGDKEGFLLRYKLSLSENNPAEQELVVDPEFIGRIFEMFMQSEERSEKGAFYTPKEITQYMSKNSIKQLLLNELPDKEEEISQLVLNHSVSGLDEDELETVQEELDDINVLDPAVGSGAFIIAVMEELVQIHEAINEELGKEEDRFNLKEDMIAGNLYGVDIDPSGIELCKFRTWLHLIQDLHIDLDELLEKNDRYALPNLDFKFFVGNSLAGDFRPTEVIENLRKEDEVQTTLTADHEGLKVNKDGKPILSLIKEIDGKRQKFTDAHGKEKERLEDEIQSATNSLENSIRWSETSHYMGEVVESAGEDFKWSIKMPEVMAEGGFDIVIGNPPYLGDATKHGNTEFLKPLADFLDRNCEFYEQIPRMNYDLYQKFIIRGEELTKSEGVQTFITSRTFRTIGSKISSRNLLLSNDIKELIIVNDDTFDAKVNPSIFLMKKQDGDQTPITYVDAKESNVSEYRNLVERNSQLEEEISWKDYDFRIYEDRDNWKEYELTQKAYRESIRNSFFEPNLRNIELLKNIISEANSIYNDWSDQIRDSKTIDDSLEEIKQDHLSELSEGDTSLFGLLTVGGHGLNTNDNDNFLAYIEGSDRAEEVKNRNESDFKYEDKNEDSYYGMSRVVREENILNPDDLTEEEKRKGIDSEDPAWLPIVKGKGESFYFPIRECINWNRESVREIEKEGVMRNRRYYFEEGLFIARGGSGNPTIRYTNNAVIDGSGGIYIPTSDQVSAKYLNGILNSEEIQYIIQEFINSTVNTQVSDIRLVPVKLPQDEEKQKMESLVKEAIESRKSDNEENFEKSLKKINSLTREIYGDR